MSNSTYRLDDAEEKLFHLYAHTITAIGEEMEKRYHFRIDVNNDIANYAVCNTAALQYFQYGQVASSYMVHNLCKVMIRLIQVYVPQYSKDLLDIINLKEGQRFTAKAGVKKPSDADSSVGIFFDVETTTKS